MPASRSCSMRSVDARLHEGAALLRPFPLACRCRHIATAVSLGMMPLHVSCLAIHAPGGEQ